MVTHAKLQYYRHNYGLVCITGALGCRWHRYKQSTRDNRKRDLCVFATVLLTFLYLTFFLYFILISRNNYDDLNWYFYEHFGTWVPYYIILLAGICVLFTYTLVLMILSLCHILHGHQLYVHPIHVVCTFVCLASCVALTIALNQLWATQWSVVWLSLKVLGPFLQIGSVILMTMLSWAILAQWFTLSKWYYQTLWLCVYLAVMMGLYIAPLFIDSPCVIATSSLPRKPRLMAHKGAPGIAPENTLISFEIADQYGVMGYETDVKISRDGVPFLLHDTTFARTTNIASVFPDLIEQDASWFNSSDITLLDAGSWYIQRDPMHSVSDVSDDQRSRYTQQKIPTLLDFLNYVNTTRRMVLFHVSLPPASHPYTSNLSPIHHVIQESGVDPKQIWWMTGLDDDKADGYTPVIGSYIPAQTLLKHRIHTANIQCSDMSFDNIREYRYNNITTNVYTVNTRWFISLYWCLGVTSVASDNCHLLSEMDQPIWHLLPRNYLILWVTVDVLSAILVIVIFIVQRIQRQGTKYSPEAQSLNCDIQQQRNGHQRADSYRRNKRAMKEKLLMKDVASELFDVETDADEVGIESNYTVQSTDGRVMAASFYRQRNGYQSSASYHTEEPSTRGHPIVNV